MEYLVEFSPIVYRTEIVARTWSIEDGKPKGGTRTKEKLEA